MIPQLRTSSWRPLVAALVGVSMHTLLACNGTAAETPAAPADATAPAAEPAATPPAPSPTRATVVARVNGAVIARKELVSAADAMRPLAARAGRASDTVEFYRGVLEELVSAELMFQEAVKQGASATPEEVAKRMQSLTSRFKDEA